MSSRTWYRRMMFIKNFFGSLLLVTGITFFPALLFGWISLCFDGTLTGGQFIVFVAYGAFTMMWILIGLKNMIKYGLKLMGIS